jgi:hypothetical protein
METSEFTREDVEAFLDVVEVNFDDCELIAANEGRVRWIAAVPGIDGRRQRVLLETSRPAYLWRLDLRDRFREGGISDVRIWPRRLCEQVEPEVLAAWEANDERLYMTAAFEEVSPEPFVDVVTTETWIAEYFNEWARNDKSDAPIIRTRAQMLERLDLRDALRRWDLQDDSIIAAANLENVTTFLAQTSRVKARTEILRKAEALGIVTTRATPFGPELA